MIVAGQTENLKRIFNTSVLKRFVKALDGPWQDFSWDRLFYSTSPEQNNGSPNAGYPTRAVIDYKRYHVDTQ